MSQRRLLLVTENYSSNSTGRTYCLWLLARELGYRVQVVSLTRSQLWSPLRESEFARDCLPYAGPAQVASIFASQDLIIACKPMPQSLGKVWLYPREHRAPLGVDIDDPDLEVALAEHSALKRIAKTALRPLHMRDLRMLRNLSKSIPSITSNPWLQERYGGVIIPHVRNDTGEGEKHTSIRPRIAFIGSNKPHKGLSTLRSAVAALAESGFTLAVTDHPPADSKPWEEWVGPTTLEAGLELLRGADIAVIASSDAPYARGQLPAKLIDAMIAGRAVVVSNVPAAPWGLGGCGLIIDPDNLQQLVDSLRTLSDPELRQELGKSARGFALLRYTPEAIKEAFDDFCTEVIESGM